MSTAFTQILKNSSAMTNDILVMLVVFIIFFSYALYFGKNRIISLLLSFYPAAYLFEKFPYISKLMFLHGSQLTALNSCIIFLIFLIPIDIIVNRFVFSDSGYGSMKMLRTAGFALAGLILTLVFTYSIVSLDVFYNFSAPIDTFFAHYLFWLTLAPLLLMFFL